MIQNVCNEKGFLYKLKYRARVSQVPSVGEPTTKVVIRRPTGDVVHHERPGRTSVVRPANK